MYVNEILQHKGKQVWSVAPQTTAYEALELMAGKNIGALVVLDQGKVVGLFSERDYARKVVLKGKNSRTTTVGDLMTRDVLCVGPDETIENCMALMTGKHTRHLPVLENDRLAGIVSIGDVVKGIITGHEFTIREMERYITGN